MNSTPQYNQVPASFTPPTQESGFSFGTDFTPLWLQINNPSSYYLTFQGSSAVVPPYTLGAVIPWGIGPGSIVISTDYVPTNAPTLPVSNAEVSILATDNPSLVPNSGVSTLSSVNGTIDIGGNNDITIAGQKVIVSTQTPPDLVGTVTYNGLTTVTLDFTPPTGATAVLVILANPTDAPVTGLTLIGAITGLDYFEGTLESVAPTDPVKYATAVNGNFESLTLSITYSSLPTITDLAWVLAQFGSLLPTALPSTNMVSAEVVVDTTQYGSVVLGNTKGSVLRTITMAFAIFSVTVAAPSRVTVIVYNANAILLTGILPLLAGQHFETEITYPKGYSVPGVAPGDLTIEWKYGPDVPSAIGMIGQVSALWD